MHAHLIYNLFSMSNVSYKNTIVWRRDVQCSFLKDGILKVHDVVFISKLAYLQFTPREIEVKCNVFGMEKIDRTWTNAEQLWL